MCSAIGIADLKPEGGRWEVIMGPRPIQGKAFLQLPEGGADLHLFLRLYWIDWNHTTRPLVEIECLDEPDLTVPLYTADQLSKQLDTTGAYLKMRSLLPHDWYDWFLKTAKEPGPIPGGNSHVKYYGQRYELAPDEALLMEFDKPEARYWCAQLYDGMVYDNRDFRRNINCRNHIQIDLDAEDRVQLVVAHQDPGIRNWLDTGGVPDGILQFRSIWA